MINTDWSVRGIPLFLAFTQSLTAMRFNNDCRNNYGKLTRIWKCPIKSQLTGIDLVWLGQQYSDISHPYRPDTIPSISIRYIIYFYKKASFPSNSDPAYLLICRSSWSSLFAASFHLSNLIIANYHADNSFASKPYKKYVTQIRLPPSQIKTFKYKLYTQRSRSSARLHLNDTLTRDSTSFDSLSTLTLPLKFNYQSPPLPPPQTFSTFLCMSS